MKQQLSILSFCNKKNLELFHLSVYFLQVISLPKPYESNCYDGKMDAISDYTTYTVSSCMSLCETRFSIKECGCRSVQVSGEFSNDRLFLITELTLVISRLGR